MNKNSIRNKISTYCHHFLNILRQNVFGKETSCNLVKLQERKNIVTKSNLLMDNKESLFAGKKVSSKNSFAMIFVVLVLYGCLCRNFQIYI
jgi:hypothetical protein